MSIIQKFSNWYFSRRALPRWGIVACDCIIFLCSALIVYVLNHGLLNTAQHFWPLMGTLLIYLLFYIIGFRIGRTYSGIIRYSSFVDLQKVALAIGVGFTLSVAFRYMIPSPNYIVPMRLRDIMIWSVVTMFAIWMLRIMVKVIYDTQYKALNAKPVFIYGIREGGVAIAKSIRNQDPASFTVAGFISDREEFDDTRMMGCKVHWSGGDVIEAMDEAGAKAVFVSPLKSELLRADKHLVDRFIEHGIKIYLVPREQEWDGKSDIKHMQMHEIEIEDLLPRDKIEVDLEGIANALKDHRILITGAAGSIGSEIVRQVASFRPQALILVDQAETPLHDVRLMMAREFGHLQCATIVADIAQQDRMDAIFKEWKPQYVFHAAAYKHVPMMEDTPCESIHNNVQGTRVIADLAVKYGTDKFVMVSTDKAVNPTNVMGCSKRICEIYVQALDKAEKEGIVKGHTQFVTTRFGNVLGSNGSVIPLFKQQIKNGGPVTVTHPEIIRYFMLIPEACKLVLEAGVMGHGGEIFVFDMGEPVKIVDLARKMIQLSGSDIEIKFTGLRDGEKLYEEVLNEKETTLPTFHPKIQIAKVREYDYQTVNRDISEMVNVCYHDSAMNCVKRMKALVPEFKSQHSVYEQLDN